MFMKFLSRLIVLPALLLFVSVVAVNAVETLKIGGTGSGLEMIRLLGKAYAVQHPGFDIVVLPSLGSSGGIKALQSELLGLAISARPASDQEKGVTSIPVCRTPLAFVVHPHSPATSIQSSSLVELYANAMSTWPGGERVRVILRPESESDTKILRSISPAADQAITRAKSRGGMILAVTDQDNLKLLQTTPGAFGMAPLSMLTAERAAVKLLSYNGVAPTVKNLELGSYRLVKEYYLVFRTPTPQTVQQFISFIKSARGRSVIGALQCAPID